ncbi:MAG: glucosaminidase domain-containing protein [Flavobacteriales bacterium]
MKSKKWIGLLVALLFVAPVWANSAEEITYSRKDYIDMWKEEAVKQMYLYKIPASITLAQGILESGDGNSMLARKGNNHFGIKCHDWTGETIFKDDDKKNECFRKYPDAAESYKDHSEFLAKRDRYARLFELNTNDYKGWAKGLKECGYATNPKYAELLIKLIEDNNLEQYDAYKYEPTPVVASVGSSTSAPKITPKTPDPGASKATAAKAKITENNVKYVHAKEGDTFYKIARENGMGLWQLYKYNDLGKSDVLMVGDVVYLQPKKNKSKVPTHAVCEGESMRDISQQYGVKLKKLYKKNEMPFGATPKAGQKLRLN